MTNFDLEEILKPNLHSTEKFVWTGKPKKGILFRRSDRFMIPFSFVWGGFTILWELIAFVTDAPLFFKLWGIPFILVGLYFIAGRFFVDAIQRVNTIYGITTERVIIQSGVFQKKIISFPIKSFSEVSLDEKDDNSGSITLWPSDMKHSLLQKLDRYGKE